MSPQSSKKFSLPSLVKDTRTRTSRHNKKGYGGGILPGGGNYGSYGSASSMAPGLWSPYARPPRRSKKLVLLWIGTLLFIGLFMWYLATRNARIANSYEEVLTDVPPKEAVVDG
ncbi:hypothetical protein SLS53_002161 [Cytospora paraplurivora]|uniref:Uncharacterized protein n=1 Tax=Cytospora paraplurivora TaxID=2898453 RepID=A0AAN9YJ59_9PEZI